MKKLCLGGLDLFWSSPNISFEFHLRFLLINSTFSSLVKCWSDSINGILINCQDQLWFYPDQMRTTQKRAKITSRYQILSLNSESHSIVKPKVQIQSFKLNLNTNINLNNCEFQSCSICSFSILLRGCTLISTSYFDMFWTPYHIHEISFGDPPTQYQWIMIFKNSSTNVNEHLLMQI